MGLTKSTSGGLRQLDLIKAMLLISASGFYFVFYSIKLLLLLLHLAICFLSPVFCRYFTYKVLDNFLQN